MENAFLTILGIIFVSIVDHPKMVGLPSVDGDGAEDEVAIIDDQDNPLDQGSKSEAKSPRLG